MAVMLTACAPDPPSRTEPAAWQHLTDPPRPASRGAVATVVDVIDGDTLRIDLDGDTVIVRLLGIDTPEKRGGPRPAECFGDEASAFAETLVPPSTIVSVHRDQESRDQYGRYLVWLHRSDGVFVNLAMVESGHAAALFFPPNDTLEPLFEAAAHQARRNWLGFWAGCGQPDLVLHDA